MNEIKIFNYEANEVRTVEINGQLWWVAKDVSDILDFRDAYTATRILETEEKLLHTLCVAGQNREITIINESGLYSLILRSNKPEAKKFKKWVTSEVLPTVRKTGEYKISKTDDEIIAIGYSKAIEKIKKLQQIVEEQKPAVKFSESVRDSKNGIIVREFCKLLTPPVGQNKFYAWLRNQKIIMPNSTEPYQEYIDRGYFARRETTYKNSDDESIVSFTTLITGKGQQYLTKKWKAKAVA